jgi:hypothetical protein
VRVNALRRAVPGNGLLLMPAAAVAVHQLRYWLAYGSRANTELAEQGHSYLHSLVPWTIFGIAVGAGLFLRRLGAVLKARSAPEASRLPAGGLWLATWIWLVAIYATQETLEAFLATGHPAGFAGVFGHGGWWAIPAAAAVALVVVALFLVGRTLLRLAGSAPQVAQWPLLSVHVPCGFAVVGIRPLASSAAGRAPPLGLLIR